MAPVKGTGLTRLLSAEGQAKFRARISSKDKAHTTGGRKMAFDAKQEKPRIISANPRPHGPGREEFGLWLIWGCGELRGVSPVPVGSM